MIEICGVTEARKAVFEAVRVEQHEFLNVSCPEISVMYGISIKKTLDHEYANPLQNKV